MHRSSYLPPQRELLTVSEGGKILSFKDMYPRISSDACSSVKQKSMFLAKDFQSVCI